MSSRKAAFAVIASHLVAYVAIQTTYAALQDVSYILALVLAQHILLYLWAGLGSGPWWLRLAFVYCLSVFAWNLPLVLRSGMFLLPIAIAQAFGTAALMASIVLPLVLARALGRRLRHFERDSLPCPKPLQVPLRTMLLVSAVVACLLAFGASIDCGVVMRANETVGTYTISNVLMFVGLPTLLTASALLSVWAALSVGGPISRLIVGAVVVAAGGAFLPYCHKGDVGAYAFWCGLTVLLFLVLSVSLLAFRAAGYRFVRAAPEDEEHPDQ